MFAMHAPGIDVVGPLPQEIQAVTVFSAAVCIASQRRADAGALLAFLAPAECDAAKRRHGMDATRDRAALLRYACERTGSEPAAAAGNLEELLAFLTRHGAFRASS